MGGFGWANQINENVPGILKTSTAFETFTLTIHVYSTLPTDGSDLAYETMFDDDEIMGVQSMPWFDPKYRGSEAVSSNQSPSIFALYIYFPFSFPFLDRLTMTAPPLSQSPVSRYGPL